MNGEKFKCKKCSGTGTIIEPDIYINSICTVCGGSGYVDWIENITGRNMRTLDSLKEDFENFYKKYTKEMSNVIAESIDEKIMKELFESNDGRRKIHVQKM